MSTRCHIIVTDNKVTHYVYHHCDGYLEGVGKDLKEFIKTHYAPTSDEFCRKLEDWDPAYEYEDSGLHGDEEYIYHIKIQDHTIEISVEREVVSKDNEGNWIVTWEEVKSFKETFKFDDSFY